MTIESTEIISRLDPADQEKVEYFVKLLLDQEKYKLLRMEINARRKEIAAGQFSSHDEFWKQMNV